MRLFKYSRITDYLIENVARSQIWFSPPAQFNDIDDSSARLDFRLTDEDISNELMFIQITCLQPPFGNSSPENVRMAVDAGLRYNAMLRDRGPDGMPDHSGKLRDSMEKALAIRRRSIGISCFCQDARNSLLWAHYADSSKGVCMEFETDLDEGCFRQLERVAYVDSLPRLKILSHLRQAIVTLYTTKTKEWAYEKEIRAFQVKYGNYRVDRQCLKSVFFGLRTPRDEIYAFALIVRQAYGDSVALFRTVRPEPGQTEFLPFDIDGSSSGRSEHDR